MATYIKTLKEDNGDITYPQTKAGAVLLNNGSDLETELSQYVTAEDIASTSALTPPVQTNMIANGAVTTGKIANKTVTSDKVDWTTLPGSAGATTVSGKMSGTSWANIGNAFKAPSNGLYFASAIFNQNGNPGATKFIMNVGIVAAGNAFSTGAASVANYAGNNNCTITLSRMAWLTAGQTIQMQGRTENWSGGVAGKMEVTRIY